VSDTSWDARVDIQDWMIEAVEYYRQHGFFVARPGTVEFALVDYLRQYEARHGRFHAPTPIEGLWPHRETGLLGLDEQRVLDLDFEVDYVGGFGMYRSTIPEIARITRGVFSAWDIRERALSHERGGRVSVEFRVGSTEHVYELGSGNSDWLDGTIFWIIEEFLKASPYRFYVASDTLQGSQGGVFTVLTLEERDAIERDRGVIFLPLPEKPAQPWTWDVENLLARVHGSPSEDPA
jgi:hypothetical protein